MSKSSLHLNIQVSENMKQYFKRLSRSIQNHSLFFDIYSSFDIFRSAFYRLQEYEDAILQIRKFISCSTQEAEIYIKGHLRCGYSSDLSHLIDYIQVYREFPLLENYEYSMCLNCRKRQWRYIGDWRGPCPYCGYYDPNIDPVFSIELGERVSFQSGDTDIEIEGLDHSS